MELSPEAKEIVSHAKKLAYGFCHFEVHTSHLLLSLREKSTGSVYAILRMFGLSSENLIREIRALYGQGPERKLPDSVDFSCSELVQNIVEELGPHSAREYGHKCVECEDLLVALLSLEKGRADQVMINLGALPHIVKAAFLELLEKQSKRT